VNSAYVIVSVEVTDTAAYERYKQLATQAVAEAGGSFVVRGGRHKVMEGSWCPTRLVVLHFPSFDQACAFYDSVLYARAREAREGATRFFNMVVVEAT
jgi:uncharacterized protein (DUF1330 family)